MSDVLFVVVPAVVLFAFLFWLEGETYFKEGDREGDRR